MPKRSVPTAPTLSQIRAKVSEAVRTEFDWIWKEYLTNGSWPCDRAIYKRKFKPVFEKLIKPLNGSYIMEVGSLGSTKHYHLMPLGILSTTEGKRYEALLRRYVGLLRDVFYNQYPKNQIRSVEVASELEMSAEDVSILGRLMYAGLLNTPPGHMPDFSSWEVGLPTGLGDVLPQAGSIGRGFQMLMRRHWAPHLAIGAEERAHQMYSSSASLEVALGLVPVAPPAKKSQRSKITGKVTVEVLAKSKRRCALCFGLKGDLGEKDGQIAHINRKPRNSTAANLAWLCLDHHAKYDATSNRNKGYTAGELRSHRADLWRAIERGDHIGWASKVPTES